MCSYDCTVMIVQLRLHSYVCTVMIVPLWLYRYVCTVMLVQLWLYSYDCTCMIVQLWLYRCHSQPSWKASCVHVKNTPRQWTTLPHSREGSYIYHRSCPKVVRLLILPRVSSDHRPTLCSFHVGYRKRTKIKINKIQGLRLELAS